MTTLKLIEDYLCDRCDTIFNDGIVCDKIYNPEQPVNRASFIRSDGSMIADQVSGTKCYAQIVENREKRSQCIEDIDKLRNNIVKYGDYLPNGLALYVELQYITMPIKIIVGTQEAYTFSCNLKIVAK